jgi:cytochrome c553
LSREEGAEDNGFIPDFRVKCAAASQCNTRASNLNQAGKAEYRVSLKRTENPTTSNVFFGGTLIALTLLAGNVHAAGDAEAGAARSAACGACHGADGNSVNPQWPSIAGQNATYIANTLRAFQDGTRSDVLMTAQAQSLSDQDIENLAAYFAVQKPTGRTADPKLAEAGERLYRGGNKETNLTACIGCHGPTGSGNEPAGYPSLTGQHATYTAKQLGDYQSKTRKSDGGTQIMRNVAARLTQNEINSLAAYIQGLR